MMLEIDGFGVLEELKFDVGSQQIESLLSPQKILAAIAKSY
jgi:hypothetical protein